MRRKLSFDDEKDLVLLGKALSSEIRIKILKLLDTKPYCVNEIAELLKIPASSATLNVKVLEGGTTDTDGVKTRSQRFYEVMLKTK